VNLGIKSVIKRGLFGKAGMRSREIPRGLLKGLRFNIDTANKSMRLLGLDESEIASVTRNLAAEARSAADVGANDGWYALYFASRPNIARVLAFEPDGAVVAAMRENFLLNAPEFLAKATLVEAFVGNKNGENGWVRLDDYLAELVEPALLKIDVDGGEIDVLEGARELLSTRDCRLIVETHSADLEKGCVERLSAMGYACRIIDNAWYRSLIPEHRSIEHNRWLVARKNR
jgi:hypothetical protein